MTNNRMTKYEQKNNKQGLLLQGLLQYAFTSSFECSIVRHSSFAVKKQLKREERS